MTFSVAANTSSPRIGTITVGGQTFTVSQDGYNCAATLGPSFADPGNAGSGISVSVRIYKSCTWTAKSHDFWVTVTSGSSGTGPGVVVLNVAPNSSGGIRVGTVTIAGQPFTITQGAGACGATDITSEMGVSRSGLTYINNTSYHYGGSITVTNNSGGALAGAVYLVLLGLPNHLASPNGNGLIGLPGGGTLTTCYSAEGDYLLPVAMGMAKGQGVTLSLTFFNESFGASIGYTTKVLSGTPSQ